MFEDGVHEKLQGDLDEIRVFRRCLSAAEILALYNGGGGGGNGEPPRGYPAGSREQEAKPSSGSVVLPAPPSTLPAFSHALHFDHGHVDLGGKQLTTGATSISFWYQYDGYTDQMALPLDLKIGPLDGVFIAINHSGDPGNGRQTVSYNNRGRPRCSFETAPYTPAAWTHVVLTYNGKDPADVAGYAAYVNGRSTALTTLGGDGGAHDRQQPRFRLLRLDDPHGSRQPAWGVRPKHPGIEPLQLDRGVDREP